MKLNREKDGYGTFGNLSQTYDVARPSMPEIILDHLFSHMRADNPSILDAGCGTGIVTRQLLSRGVEVTGADIDSRMIEVANSYQDEIEYHVAPTENLPLSDATFNAVTAFSAFHWFANDQALTEVKRVLKNDGILFIANRNQVGDIREQYLNILRIFVDEKLPNAKKDYKPAELLQSFGFFDVEERKTRIIENLTIEQILAHVQTTSLWNLVQDTKKEEVLIRLEDFFTSVAVDGFVERPIEIQVVVGREG